MGWFWADLTPNDARTVAPHPLPKDILTPPVRITMSILLPSLQSLIPI
jgi:hypothetical protein